MAPRPARATLSTMAQILDAPPAPAAGLSSAEAASRLSISVDNLAVRLSRARERIREELARRGWIDPGGAA